MTEGEVGAAVRLIERVGASGHSPGWVFGVRFYRDRKTGTLRSCADVGVTCGDLEIRGRIEAVDLVAEVLTDGEGYFGVDAESKTDGKQSDQAV